MTPNRRSSAHRTAREARAIEHLGIKRLATDSRRVVPGDTFVAYPGETRDGRSYIGQALANGAASVLWERRGFAWQPEWQVPNLGITDLRRHAGEIASRVCGHPSSRLWTVGITGTNGKTSCCHWIAQSLGRSGRKCAVVGTLGNGFPGALEPSANTTPDAVWLHGALARFLKEGARAASIEVSSHGLAQHRLAGVAFDVALLTNVSRDHLDYHGSMRAYRAAKARLFRWPTLQWAVLNLDDRFGAELAPRLRRPGLNVLGYGFLRMRGASGRKRVLRVQGRNLNVGAKGVSFEVTSPWGSASIRSPLTGRFNAANLLGAFATLVASDVRPDEAAEALRRVRALPGRTERHGGGRQPAVIIDYAHTPHALEQVLLALRETLGTDASRLICVFGCGGERDRGKRALMGAVASRLADRTFVTSDNPRSEDPHAIIADIVKGTRNTAVTVEPDRARAIEQAICMGRRGDVVLVAGKGHEAYQEIGGMKHPFSDRAVVAAALGRRRAL